MEDKPNQQQTYISGLFSGCQVLSHRLFPKRQLLKCTNSHAATLPVFPNRSTRPIAFPSRSARPPSRSVPLQPTAPQKAQPYLWEVAVWENVNLGSRPWESTRHRFRGGGSFSGGGGTVLKIERQISGDETILNVHRSIIPKFPNYAKFFNSFFLKVFIFLKNVINQSFIFQGTCPDLGLLCWVSKVWENHQLQTVYLVISHNIHKLRCIHVKGVYRNY